MFRRGGRAASATAAVVEPQLAALTARLLRLLRGDAESSDGETVDAVTVVFTDLEGFTRYTATHGDEAARTLLGEHDRLAAAAVSRWDGRVVKHLGDGLMLAFTAREPAIRAAIELAATAPPPLRLRAGVHTGEAILTADDVIGHVVNVAARVAGLAAGGQVFVTAETLAGIELDGVRASRPRRRALKGIGDRVSVIRLQAQPASSTSTQRVPE